MSEITVTFTEDEARALVPWKGSTQTVDAWNKRSDRAEDAMAKIRAALREQAPAEVSPDQATLGGLAA